MVFVQEGRQPANCAATSATVRRIMKDGRIRAECTEGHMHAYRDNDLATERCVICGEKVVKDYACSNCLAKLSGSN